MSDIVQVFQFEADPIRTVELDGVEWVVAKDVCTAVGISKYRDAVAQLDDDERESAVVDTPGGPQHMALVNESGVYALLLISRSPKVKRFRKWVTSEVIPAIRKTGSYAVPTQRKELTNRELALMVIAEADRADAAEALATERGEQLAIAAPKAAVLDAIEAGEGMNPRSYRKSYFPDIPENEYFAHLYRKGLLINQRGAGTWDRKNQCYRDGPQHGHPGAAGNPYFYLHAQLDKFDVRRYHARVRPGKPEIQLRDLLIRQGLTPKLITDADLEGNAQ